MVSYLIFYNEVKGEDCSELFSSYSKRIIMHLLILHFRSSKKNFNKVLFQACKDLKMQKQPKTLRFVEVTFRFRQGEGA